MRGGRYYGTSSHWLKRTKLYACKDHQAIDQEQRQNARRKTPIIVAERQLILAKYTQTSHLCTSSLHPISNLHSPKRSYTSHHNGIHHSSPTTNNIFSIHNQSEKTAQNAQMSHYCQLFIIHDSFPHPHLTTHDSYANLPSQSFPFSISPHQAESSPRLKPPHHDSHHHNYSREKSRLRPHPSEASLRP